MREELDGVLKQWLALTVERTSFLRVPTETYVSKENRKSVFRSAVSLFWTQSCWLQTGSSSVLISAEVEGLRIGVFNGVLLVEMFVAESQSSSVVVAW